MKHVLYILSCIVLFFTLSMQVGAQEIVDLFNQAPADDFGGIWNGPVDLSGDASAIPPTGTNNQPTETQTLPETGTNNQPTQTQTLPEAGTNQNKKTNTEADYLITNPLGKTTSLSTIIVNIVQVVQILLIMAAVLYIIWAGFLFVSAKGDTSKIIKARNALLWGFVGVALVLGAQVIVTTIKNSVNSVFYDTTKK